VFKGGNNMRSKTSEPSMIMTENRRNKLRGEYWVDKESIGLINERIEADLKELFALAKHECDKRKMRVLIPRDFEIAFERIRGKFILDFIGIQISELKAKHKEVTKHYECSKENIRDNE